jgi:hypothetical protein
MKRASSGSSQDDEIPLVTERRRKSHPRLPVDDNEESDGAQADEEPLAGSRVRTGLSNYDATLSNEIPSPAYLGPDAAFFYFFFSFFLTL